MFHSVDDGKGLRYVYVNGNRIERVLWANEEQGLVCFYLHVRLSKKSKRKGEIYTRLLRGNVTVEFIKNEASTTSTKATSS